MKTSPIIFALLGAATLATAQENYGTIRATTKLRPDGTTSTTITDPDKKTAEETIADAKGKTLRKTTYILGDRDISVGAIFSDAKGAVLYKASYQRDGVGRVIETKFAAADDRYLGKRIFVYGAGDQVSRVEDYNAQNQLISKPAEAKTTTVRKRR